MASLGYRTEDPSNRIVRQTEPDLESYQEGELSCERQRNAEGRVLELCLHSGGHRFRPADVVRAWRELEALGAVSAD